MSVIRVTLSVDEATYRKAQAAARAMGKKISHLTDQFFQSLANENPAYATPAQSVAARLRGAYPSIAIDPKQARLERLKQKHAL